MKTVKVFVDTSADMPMDMAQKYNIDIINFLCTFGETSYTAGEELSNDEFYKMLEETDEIPKTSQTPPAVMYDKLLDAARNNDTVVYFTISSKASGQYNNAVMNAELIKEELPNADVRIIDTLTFSAYISETAFKFCELIESGVGVDEALEESKKVLSYYETYLFVDSLKYLQKGGRITKTAAIVGELLDIKPVLGIRNGLIEPLDKLRGKKKVIKKLIDLIEEDQTFDADNKEFIIVDSNEEFAKEAEELLKERFGIEKLVRNYKFGPIVGTHTGANTLAILFKRK